MTPVCKAFEKLCFCFHASKYIKNVFITEGGKTVTVTPRVQHFLFRFTQKRSASIKFISMEGIHKEVHIIGMFLCS